MRLIEINTNPPKRDLLIFGLLWLTVFGTFALIGLGKGWGQGLTIGLGVVAMTVPLVGLLVPGFMRRAYVASTYAAWPIGMVVSHVLLAAIYFLVLTPIALIMRAVGHDPMRMRAKSKAKTYWIDREEQSDVKRYFRQY